MVEELRTGYWLDLETIAYAPAFEIQEALYRERVEGRLPTVVIVQENLPVFTIGRTGSRSNILAPDAVLAQQGIEVREVNRGGDVTFHGPGQIVVSPLVFLGDIGMNANQYFHCLEDVLICLLAGYGIDAGKKEGLPGAWCGEAKIGAVGIAVRHGYVFHGFSLNVNPDLKPFGWINPCGVARMPVTSMQAVLGREVSASGVRDRLKAIIGRTFGLELAAVGLADIELPGAVPASARGG